MIATWYTVSVYSLLRIHYLPPTHTHQTLGHIEGLEQHRSSPFWVLNLPGRLVALDQEWYYPWIFIRMCSSSSQHPTWVRERERRLRPRRKKTDRGSTAAGQLLMIIRFFSAHIVCSRLCNGSFLLWIFTQQEKVVVTDRTRYIKLLPIILMCHNLSWFMYLMYCCLVVYNDICKSHNGSMSKCAPCNVILKFLCSREI